MPTEQEHRHQNQYQNDGQIDDDEKGHGGYRPGTERADLSPGAGGVDWAAVLVAVVFEATVEMAITFELVPNASWFVPMPGRQNAGNALELRLVAMKLIVGRRCCSFL